jgi:predicted glycoside hydrolase/deacetylase ChbG (UPF0249 family)
MSHTGAESRMRLIVNADDFGFTPSVNAGIVEAHLRGIVTSASMFVNLPGWEDGIAHMASLRSVGNRLSIGLHLNLLIGSPVTHCPSLTNHRTGVFHSFRTLIARALLHRVDANEIEAECTAQLQRLADVGIRATHVDSHRHTHGFPGFYAPVARAAERAGIRFVRVPLEPFSTGRRSLPVFLKKLYMHNVLRRAAGGRPPVPSVGMSLTGDPQFGRDIVRLVGALSPGTWELMVHPGYTSPELVQLDGYAAAREDELAALVDPATADQIRECGVELISFADV